MPSKRVSLKGKGADLFFGDYTPPPDAAPDTAAEEQPVLPSQADMSSEPGGQSALPPAAAPEPPPQPTRRLPHRRQSSSSADGYAADEHARSHTSQHASTLASTNAEVLEAIRKVVKVPGREVSFVRLSPEEKAQLADIVYTYKRQGQKTSETEINRIAINYLLHDYHEHGERSVLARVLAALLA